MEDHRGIIFFIQGPDQVVGGMVWSVLQPIGSVAVLISLCASIARVGGRHFVFAIVIFIRQKTKD
jgi:hypothetical protein